MSRRQQLALALTVAATLSAATARAQTTETETPTLPTVVSETPPTTTPAAPSHDATASLTQSEGLVLTAPENIAQLRLGAVLILRGTVANTESTGTDGQVAVRNVRLRMNGHVAAPWLQYFVQIEFADTPRLLDASITIAPLPIFQVRVGQFLQPFGLEWEANPAELLMPESSPVGSFYGLGRDAGLELMGHTDDGFFAYWAMVTMGNPVTLSNDVQVRDGIVLGRLQIQPFGQVPEHFAPYADGEVEPALSIAIAAYGGTIVRSDSRYDSITAGFNATAVGRFTEGVGDIDARYVNGPVSAAVQIDGGWRRNADDLLAPGEWGLAAMGQVGVFVWQHILEVATRWSILDPDFEISDDLFASGELALVVYPIGTHVAASLRYGAAHQGAPGFPITTLGREWIHIGTLQLQAFL